MYAMYDREFPRFSHKLDSIAEEILQRRTQRKERDEDFRRKLNEFRARFQRVTCNRVARLRMECSFIRKAIVLERLSESTNENKDANKGIKLKSTIMTEAKGSPNDELRSLDKESSQLSLPLSRGLTSSSLGRRTPRFEEERRPSRTPTSERSASKLTIRSSYSPSSSFRRVSWKMQTVQKMRSRSRENTLTIFTPMAGLDERNLLQINADAESSDLKLPMPEGKKWRFAVGRTSRGSRKETEECVCGSGNCGLHPRTSQQKIKTASTAINCAWGFQQKRLE